MRKTMELSLKEEFRKSWLTSLIGFALACGGIWLLSWNEGRAVHHAHSLDEAYKKVVPLNIYEPMHPELDGMLVHISGHLLIDEPLTEPEYGISLQTVKLKRRVQMYQWVEERTPLNFNPDDSTRDERSDSDYYYVTEWRDKLVDSNGFYIRHGHHNPTEMPLHSHIYVSPSVRVGQLYVGDVIKQKFDDYVEVTSDERPERLEIKLHMGIYYHCDDVFNPEVGDIRIQFYYAGHNGDPVSIIAMQKDGNLVPYTTSLNHKVAILTHGIHSVNQMFASEHSDAKLQTWKLRAAGLFVLYASSVCLARLFRIICLRTPALKRTFSCEIGASTSFVLALSVALFVIAISWLSHRPLVAVGLLTASCSPFLYCIMSIFNGVVNPNGFYTR